MEYPDANAHQKEVERRAYYIYLQRGAADGHAVDDWLLAEKESLERKGVGFGTTRNEEPPASTQEQSTVRRRHAR